MEKQLYNMNQVAELLGVTYNRIWYATVRGYVTPWTAGSARLFDETHVETLRRHFAEKKNNAELAALRLRQLNYRHGQHFSCVTANNSEGVSWVLAGRAEHSPI